MTRCAIFSLTICLGIVGFSASGQPAPAAKSDPAAEKALQDLTATWGKLRSLSADVEATMNMAGPNGRTLALAGTGGIEYLKKDPSGLTRIELKVRPPGAAADMTLANVLCVFSGTAGAAQLEMFGRVREMKLDTEEDERRETTGHLVADLLRGHFALTLLADSVIDGQDARGLEGTPLFAAPPEASFKAIRAWFSKDSGATLKIEAVDAAGGTPLTVLFKNIKRDPEIAAERFTLPALPAPEPAPPQPAPAPPAAGGAAQ